MRKNRELILKVAKAIKRHPNNFEMGTWGDSGETGKVCDTTACIAGWTLMEAFDNKVMFDVEGTNAYVPMGKVRKLEKRYGLEVTGQFKRRCEIPTSHTAMRLLGLNEAEAETLFHISNWPRACQDLGEVQGAIKLLTKLAGRGPRQKNKAIRTNLAARRQQQDTRVEPAARQDTLDTHEAEAVREEDLVLV